MTAAAVKDFCALPEQVQDAVDAALMRYAIEGLGDVTALKNSGCYRLRVGRDRVIFDEDRTTNPRRLHWQAGDNDLSERPRVEDDPFDTKLISISTPKGDELVVLTRAHYDRLMASERSALKTKDIGADAQDDSVAIRRRREWDAAGKPSIPLAVIRRVRAGDSYLKAIRTFRKMTQSELSEKVGITQSYLSEIESGRRPLNDATSEALARALDIHPIFLSEAALAATGDPA